MLTDPPYGETVCAWDQCCVGWLPLVPSDCLWCFGSFRFFLANACEFQGWKFAQELIWEKQNGSGANVDRFNRVHEILLQYYRGAWGSLNRDVPRFPSTDKRSHRTQGRGITPHRGQLDAAPYNDDGTRMCRSVVRFNSLKGSAVHPTQKPVELVALPVQYSCPSAGTVLDPFMGSGTTLVAAKRLGRRTIGIEIEEKYCEIAARRVEAERLTLFEAAEKTQGDLFNCIAEQQRIATYEGPDKEGAMRGQEDWLAEETILRLEAPDD